MKPIKDIPIRVLIIEDTDDDKELVLRQLKKGGYKPEYNCIETSEELIQALDKQSWEIILCDYSMPKFNGLAALQIVKQKELDIPFILISGTVGEEIAVEAMKAGAQDYLMKDSLIRLVPVVKRELADAKIRKEKKLADEEIRHQNAILDAIINSAQEGIVVYDLDLKIVTWNPYMENITGMSTSEVLGKQGENLFPFLKDAGVIDNIKKALKGETNITIDFPYEISTNGEKKWASDTIAPMQNSMGEIIGAISTVKDITAHKIAEQELLNAKEKAEESDRLKSAFLANMSHEIRTPMNGILGFAYLLKEPKLTGQQQQEYIDVIERSGARMLNIINDIVDISKIEAGLITLNITESNINEQIEYIYTFFKPETEAKGMELSFINPLPSIEAIIKTDREKVFAILTNLVKNAIKYTNKGSIEFGYNKKGDFIEFFVKDTGIGIPKDRQKAIFERFIQADIEDKMAQQGAGLGLSITKAYVKILGGEIWVDSTEENLNNGKAKGSTFYFTIPYNKATKKEHAHDNINFDDKAPNLNLKILIVEDDEASNDLLSIILNQFEKETISVINGNDALKACRNNPDIDLIMMDIQIPGMSGYEATQQIRKFNKEVVIIAQTAYGLSGDREKAIEAGCNDYISKPVNKNELYALIQKYFKK